MARSKNESININIFTVLKVSEKSKVPVLIMSNPGLGKSTTVEMFAKVRGYELQLLRGNSTSETEVLGYDVADTASTEKKTTVHCRPSWFNEVLENEANGKKTLLFLDEITTANEFVQSALLHLIFERKVGSEPLPESTLIVSAGNYSQNLSNQMNLLPPLMNRFLIYNITPSVNDLDSFLCKYEGAIASKDGSPINFLENMYNQMKDIDSQELKVDYSTKNKIGEYFERGIKTVMNFLMTSGDRPVDLRVRDLQSIYSDVNDNLGDKLYGFVTFRTMNYLRDVAISMYLSFGKPGILSDNFRNMIDGLCGISLSYKKSKSGGVEVKTTLITKDIYDTLASVVNDIEKLNNTSLSQYEEFFNTITTDAISFDIPKMQAVINKISEMVSDKSISNIERPIEPEVVKNLCKIIKTTAGSSIKISLNPSSGKITDSMPAEEFAGRVVVWNTIIDMLGSITKVVMDSRMGYKSDLTSVIKSTEDELKNFGLRLRTIRKLITNEDESLGNIIPEVKSFTK